MKLHHVPGSRSCRVRWLLEELGVDYELETHGLGSPSLREEGYRAKNPLGRVPTLEDGEVAFYESGAIVQYLLERHGAGRLEPAIESSSRGPYLQWFHWGEATLMPPMGVIMGNRFVLREEDRSEVALRVARVQLAKFLGVLDHAVEGRRYLIDDTFTAADIMVGYSVSLAKAVGELPESPTAVHAWFDGLSQRPAFQRAFEGGFGSE